MNSEVKKLAAELRAKGFVLGEKPGPDFGWKNRDQIAQIEHVAGEWRIKIWPTRQIALKEIYERGKDTYVPETDNVVRIEEKKIMAATKMTDDPKVATFLANQLKYARKTMVADTVRAIKEQGKSTLEGLKASGNKEAVNAVKALIDSLVTGVKTTETAV